MTDSIEFERKALAVVTGALDVPTHARRAFLDRACGEDTALRRQVESILARQDKEARLPEILHLPDSFQADETENTAASHQRHEDGSAPRLAADSPADIEAIERIGRFVIRRRLGRGGFGQVYQAYDERLKRDVALKVLKPELRRFAKCYDDEARAVAALRHPGIVAIYGFHAYGDLPVIEYEFVEGGDLRQMLAPDARPSCRTAAGLVAEVADALQFAHDRHYLHLDIKPANILLDKDGHPRIADFGLAVTTQQLLEGNVLTARTPAYTSPEQAEGRTREYGAWSDIFSLGAVLYELLTGEPPPLPTSRRAAPKEDALFTDEVRSSLPRPMVAICTRALALEPSERFATAAQMRQALLSVVSEDSATNDETVASRARGDTLPGSRAALRSHMLSFQAFIEDRTRGFIGRGFVCDAVDEFIADPTFPSGYFIIRGEPGIGKSALMAHLVQKHECKLYHFNIALQGINTPRHFLGNVCASLIVHYDLPVERLPDGFERDGAFLNELLSIAKESPKWREPLLIVIDALDEVIQPDSGGGGNLLYLPPSLPDGVFVVVSTRPRFFLRLRVQHQRTLDIKADSPENLQDAQRYIKGRARLRGVRTWLKEHHVSRKDLTNTLLEKSEGNFMYLRHVLSAVAAGTFADFTLQQLPEGLVAYYRAHWNQMRNQDAGAFDSVHRRVVCVLAAVQEAVSIDRIARFTNLQWSIVRHVVRSWREFLYEERVGREFRYRLYHQAFQDFLSDEIDPKLSAAHSLIVDHYLGERDKQ